MQQRVRDAKRRTNAAVYTLIYHHTLHIDTYYRLEQKEKAHTAALLTMDKLQFNIREAENREMQAATHQAELIAQKDASDNLAEHYSKEVSAKEHIIAEYVKQQDGWIEK
jgi:hypothetical protein